jgi:hypothetical protein
MSRVVERLLHIDHHKGGLGEINRGCAC